MPEPSSARPAISLGHAVLRVSDLDRALAFYRDALGLTEVARCRGMVFLSGGERHHDLALIETRAIERDAAERLPGLHHLAFRIGNDLDALRALRNRLQGMGIPILGTSDHRVSQSLYLCDPDGVLIELYVDADPAIWRADPAAVAHVGPLEL